MKPANPSSPAATKTSPAFDPSAGTVPMVRPDSAVAPSGTPTTAPAPASDLTCPTCGTTYPPDTAFCARDGAALIGERLGTLTVGQVIDDRYRVMRKLGEGGMGEVYLCEHVLMGSPAAIKLLRRAFVSDSDAIARFLREARNASRVVHPHVARIFDLGETPDHLVYIAMEYIDGPSLASVLKEERAMPPRRVAGILSQVTSAVEAAHALGIVHRDLKPDNVMLARTRDGGDDVRLVDFGVAKAVGSEEQAVTQSGLVVGTPAYMSPEQLIGSALDGRSDLYSIAVMAFVMLTGELPFVGETAEQTMMARLTGHLHALHDVRPDVTWSPALQTVFNRALAQSRDDRYQSAEELGLAFMQAVTAVESPPPVRAGDRSATTKAMPTADAPTTPIAAAAPPPPGPGDRAAAHRPRLPRRIALAAAAIAVLALGGVVSSRVLRSGDTPKTDPSTRPETLPVANRGPAATRDSLAADSVRRLGTPAARHPDSVVFDARRALDQLHTLADPQTITPASARRVLTAVPRLLPYFTTRADSVEALYHAAEARIAINDSAGACHALAALHPRAHDTRFAVGIDALQQGMACQ